jgi:adenine-specific DNA-methyltransferase
MPLLHWLNKDSATKAAAKSAYRLLEEVPELSYGDKNSENLLIQGDNLEALKALLPFYAGRVKCIYIDPPYNTKSAFETYDDNLEHSKWLSVMYPRLEMLWELLTEDGVILISINDDEGHYLKVICDEIFGRKNFISSLIWHYEGNTDNQAKIINYHEYVHLYSKSGGIDSVNVIDPNIKDGSKLNNPEIRNTIVKNGPKNPPKPVVIPTGFPANFEAGRVEPENVNWPQYDKPIEISNFVVKTPVTATTGWSSKKILEDFINGDFKPVLDSKGQETTFELIKTGAIEAVKKRKQDKGHFLSVLRGFGTTNQMRIQLEKQGLKFSYPKPVELVKYLISAFSKDGDIVLDSFAGSGTTGHAVLSGNFLENVDRKFILIEMSQDNATKVIGPRIRHVIDGHEKAEIPATGGGFSFCKLGPTVFDEFGMLNHEIKFSTLAAHIWYIETHLPLGKKKRSPLIGIHNGTAYYLLYNGILGDKRPNGGNVLTGKTLELLPEFDGPKVIYGETARLGDARLKKEGITFKQIPYDVKAL